MGIDSLHDYASVVVCNVGTVKYIEKLTVENPAGYYFSVILGIGRERLTVAAEIFLSLNSIPVKFAF